MIKFAYGGLDLDTLLPQLSQKMTLTSEMLKKKTQKLSFHHVSLNP